MKRLKRLLTQASLATFSQVVIASSVFAMCMGFPLPGRSLEPAQNTKTLIVFENGRQHTIVQPEFTQSLEEFALVMPAPSLPTVTPAQKDLFPKLEDFTNPELDFRGIRTENFGLDAAVSTSTEEASVRVIERQDVGSFTATTLEANDLTLLLEWLDDNGYESNEATEEILEYYIEDNAYFVALKVNMSEVTDGSGIVAPVDISFEADAPVVPTRQLAGTPFALDYIVYVLAPQPYVIPGGDVQYAKKLTLGDVVIDGSGRSLLGYNGMDQWLVRNKITVDPDRVTADTPLLRIADASSSEVQSSDPRRYVNLNEYDESSGVVDTCVIEERRYLTDEEVEFFEVFISGRFSRNQSELTSIELNQLWNKYPELQYQRTLEDENGRYIEGFISDERIPSECTNNGYTFDLGVGDIDRGGGLPLLSTIKLASALILAAFVGWRLWLVKKHGVQRLLPNPLAAARTSAHWVEHKTGRKLNFKSELSNAAHGYRNITVLGVLFTVFIALGFWYGDVRRLEVFHHIVIWSSGLLLAIWGVFTLFIKPTAIQVRDGWKGMFRYLFSVLIGVLVYAILAIAFAQIGG